MNTRLTSRHVAAMLMLVSTGAMAEWRCDCTTIVASCTASVAIQESWVEVSSTQQACARVDYLVDGIPFVALVVDGPQRQDWIAGSDNPDVIVQSCQVCMDNAANGVVRPTSSADSEATELTPVIQVSPTYPPDAAAAGVEGFVEVSFTVTPSGAVTDARVSSSEPAGVFDAAAVASIERRRYESDEARPEQNLIERVEFDIGDAILSLRTSVGDSNQATARSTSRVRSQCVREQVAYNFGEVIEVGLINACNEALVVFSCGEGTGRYRQRWVCVSSEQTETLLVPPNDDRIGSNSSVAMPTGQRDFRFAGDIYLTRAPNSQYWWMACNQNDLECRDVGRQWLRSIDRQSVSVNPQDRTQIRLARAY